MGDKPSNLGIIDRRTKQEIDGKNDTSIYGVKPNRTKIRRSQRKISSSIKKMDRGQPNRKIKGQVDRKSSSHSFRVESNENICSVHEHANGEGRTDVKESSLPFVVLHSIIASDTINNPRGFSHSISRTESRVLQENVSSKTINREQPEVKIKQIENRRASNSCDVKSSKNNCTRSVNKRANSKRKIDVKKEGATLHSVIVSDIKTDPKTPLMYTYKKNAKKQFTCTVCDMKFKENRAIKNHMYLHSKKTFSCSFCSRKFHQKYTWQRHVENSHHFAKPYDVYPFKCTTCPKSFQTQLILDSHQEVRNHYAVVEQPKLFAQSKANLSAHSKPIICNKCSIKFTSKFAFQRHLKTDRHLNFDKHLNSVFKPAHCTLCSQSFSSKRNLRRHCQENQGHLQRLGLDKNDKLRVYSCVQCSSTFTNRSNLDRHNSGKMHLERLLEN